ncbi:MAG: alkaline phosphatase family protein [Myxococcales bacterium]|nr:alkaline phosphatase family protein [Myxococcales bacterium]
MNLFRCDEKRRVRVPTLLAFVCGLAAYAAPASPGAVAPTVIIISMDGVRHDAVDDERLPGFARILAEGARARALVPVFPSSTFPNHVSLATGAPTDRHGIVGNRFRDRQRGSFDYDNDASWIQAEPLWVAAERQGRRAATFYWVGSETAWHGISPTHSRAPFSSETPEGEKVRQILAWLDLPLARRPQLVMSWWHGSDHVAHRYGPKSERVHAALAAQDEALRGLLRGLDERAAWDSTTLYVVSDHGMTTATELVDPVAALSRAGVDAEVTYGMAVAHAFSEHEQVRNRVLRIWNNLPRVVAYRQRELPAALRFAHPSRTGDVVALVSPPARFAPQGAWRRGTARVLSWFGATVGAHGYDPAQVPEMNGIWLAMGRGITRAQLAPAASVLDVAASAARLLGIEPPRHSEGRARDAFAGGAGATMPRTEEPR